MLTGHRLITYEILYALLATTSFLGSDAKTTEIYEKPSPAPKMLTHHFFKNDASEIGNYFPKYETPHSLHNFPVVNSRVDDSKISTMSNDVFPDSRIFYFRMPVSATPYVYLSELENFINHIHPAPFVPYDMMPSTFPIHLPITFTSNGKPTGIYKYPQNDFQSTKVTSRPTGKPTEKPVINLNKGPYTFNGKPSDIYLLQDAFSSILSNSLSSFYP